LACQISSTAPESGSLALNGKIIAEQIGAQIFIDGWAMVAPGDPELAVVTHRQMLGDRLPLFVASRYEATDVLEV